MLGAAEQHRTQHVVWGSSDARGGPDSHTLVHARDTVRSGSSQTAAGSLLLEPGLWAPDGHQEAPELQP